MRVFVNSQPVSSVHLNLLRTELTTTARNQECKKSLSGSAYQKYHCVAEQTDLTRLAETSCQRDTTRSKQLSFRTSDTIRTAAIIEKTTRTESVLNWGKILAVVPLRFAGL